MTRCLHFYKWFVAFVVLICSTTTLSAQTKVTSTSQLKAGSVIKIYPKDSDGASHYGESNNALACSGDEQPLTSYEKAGSGDEWTLEDAGDGYCFLKNNNGCYWAYQGNTSEESLKCTMDKSSAVKICLSWDTKYSGVCFWNKKDGRGLNNLNGWYNWCSDSNDYSYDANTTFDVALLKEGSGNIFEQDSLVAVVNGIKYWLDAKQKTAKVLKNDYSGDIVIPENVTYDNVTYKVISLRDECFDGCSSLSSISLPSGITSLGDACFRGCSSLTSISLPSGITELGKGCFYGCSSLTSINLPSSITSLGESCFSGCRSLTSIELPSNITSLGGDCFRYCISLTSMLCLAVEPPIYSPKQYHDPHVVYNTTRLYVPKESIDKYKQNSAWNGAKGIYPLYPTSSVSLAKEMSVNKAKPTKIDYTIMPENTGTKELEWSSENPEVATVDANGVVTGKKIGKTVITAKTKDGTDITVSTTLTVLPKLVETMAFAEPSVSIVKTMDKTITLTFKPEEADKRMVWTSSDESVATVAQNPNASYPVEATVKAHKVGKATIKAEAQDGSGMSATCEVEVTRLPVSTISLPAELSIVKTDSIKLECSILPLASDNKKLKWSSNAAHIASVDENTGVIKARKVGDAVITATATDGSGVSASTKIHVTPIKVSQIDMAKEIYLLRTLSKQIEVNIAPELADNKTLKWTSDNESVATVTQEGVVKGVNDGNANITATTTDGTELSATCKVTVASGTMELSTKTINLRKGESYAEQIVTVLPENYEHKDVVWASADKGIASVNSEGVITAVKPGITTIKYSLGFDSSITAECKVIVYDENVVYMGGIYYIIDKKKSEATVTSIYGGQNTSLDAKQVAQCYSGTINIPENVIYEGYKYTVTKVGSYAFNCQNDLQSIYIPRTVKEIEPYAAIKAEKLNRVNVADESLLENIGEQAFKMCVGLKRFVFDGTSLKLNTIGYGAFNGCTALEKVLWTAKSELKTIKDYAFFKCTSLNNFDMPNSTLSVGNSAFRYNEGLTDIQLSTSLNYIDEYAFGECGFSHITLPESLANIQAGAFINNEHLKEITLPEQLQGLGSAAFENNSALESVTFHTALETMTIGNNAFNLCPVLGKVFITNMKSFAQTNFNNAKANPANTSQHIYNADGEEIINVMLPKGTKYINNNAFNGCAYIQSIKMPATMDHINDDIFVGCSALKDVYCYAEEVPEFIGVNDPSAMNDVFANATLHVVYGHEQAYNADAWWKRFSKVEGCDAPSDDEVTSVVLNQTELTMKPDDTIQLTATVYPTNAANNKVVWTSSNEDVAMVTDDGFVLAMAEGEADITAASAENSSIKAVCHIKVENEKEPVVTIVDIKFEESPVTIHTGENKKLNVLFNPIDATNKQLEWKTTRASVVDVDQDGNIVGMGVGKAIITAKTTDGSNLSINCVVTVVPPTDISYITIGNVKLMVDNRRLKVEGLADKDIIQVVDYGGTTIYCGTDREVYLNTAGVYIVKVKGKTLKIFVK